MCYLLCCVDCLKNILIVVCSYYILFEYYLVEVVVYIGFVDKLAEVDNVSAGVVDVIVVAAHVHVA